MKKAIINLLKVKSIISLAVVLTTCYLTITGKLEVASFMALTGAIVTYYFKKDDKDVEEIDSKEKNNEIEGVG